MIHMKQSDPDSSASTGDSDVDSEANAASYLTRFVGTTLFGSTELPRKKRGFRLSGGRKPPSNWFIDYVSPAKPRLSLERKKNSSRPISSSSTFNEKGLTLSLREVETADTTQEEREPTRSGHLISSFSPAASPDIDRDKKKLKVRVTFRVRSGTSNFLLYAIIRSWCSGRWGWKQVSLWGTGIYLIYVAISRSVLLKACIGTSCFVGDDFYCREVWKTASMNFR